MGPGRMEAALSELLALARYVLDSWDFVERLFDAMCRWGGAGPGVLTGTIGCCLRAGLEGVPDGSFDR